MFTKEPAVVLNALAEIIKAVIPMLIIFGILHWTDQQIAAVMLTVGVTVTALVTVLQRSASTPTSDVNALIRTATQQPPGTDPALVKEIQARKDAA